MTKEMFSEEDKVEIRMLYNRRPAIIQQYNLYVELKDNYEAFIKAYRKLYQSQQKIETEKKLLRKRMEQEMFECKSNLTALVKTWNTEMDVFMKKYDYEKLNDFLLVQPIYRKIGLNRTTSQFATETKNMAQSQGIVILKGDMRYGYGSVQTTNFYPTKWLKDVYQGIYERTDKNRFGV